MSDLPAPLTPADCDLRGLEWMPMYGDRLFTSETWLLASPEARCAALVLWWAAWKQTPAASLADDDRLLSQLAGYGMAVKAWRAIRDEALRGFVKCSDGRLYHPVVAELAIEAWGRRVEFGEKRERHAERMRQWRENKASKQRDDRSDGSVTVTASSRDAPGDGSVPSLTGTGQDRTGKEEKNPPTPRRRGESARALEGFDEFWRYYPRKTGKGAAEKAWPTAVKAAGGDPSEIVDGLKANLHLFDRRDDDRFVPHPATWLNAKRWLDGIDGELPVSPPPAPLH